MKSDILFDTVCKLCSSKDIERIEVYHADKSTVILMQCKKCKGKFKVVYEADAC